MLFNSLTFVVFFAAVLLLHNLPFSWRAKKFNLLWASYIFYGAWNPPFVLILMATTVVDWLAAKAIHRAATPGWRRGFLIASLVANLGMLVFFKYGSFLLENFTLLINAAGFHYSPPQWTILLPIGISFYTFHSLSYVLDVYRKKAAPVGSFLDYALFVTFFPTLVAGPILRVHQFIPQLPEPRRATAQQLGYGLALLVLGLFQKCVLADGIFAPVVDTVYSAHSDPDTFSAWVATLAFGGQIYCDFGGYSTCAVGAALCFGFTIPGNFRFPFGAVGFIDFWTRWHISLSTWMRDYVFFSMPGSRRPTARASVNLFLTMALIGLWHGAAWTFVIWGALHGSFLIAEYQLRRQFSDMTVWKNPCVQFSLALLTLALGAIAAVFFRAGSLAGAFVMIEGLVGMGGHGYPFSLDRIDAGLAIVAGFGVFLTHWRARNTTLEVVLERWPWWVRAGGLAVMLILIATLAGEDRAFIYFQF